MLMPCRPRWWATMAVVPVPPNGSRMVALGGDQAWMMRLGHSVGKAA